MAWGFSHFITSRYHDYPNLEAGLYATPHAAFVSASYKF
jgi:hypothetical protein